MGLQDGKVESACTHQLDDISSDVAEDTLADMSDGCTLLQLGLQHTNSSASQEYHLVAQHKTGSGEAEMACERMKTSIHTLFEQPLGVFIDAPWDTLGVATNQAMMHRNKPSCIAHFNRNPFELLVSGYLYHKAGSEPWLFQSFGSALNKSVESCQPDYRNGQMSGFCKGSETRYWDHIYTFGLAQVYMESREGDFADLLPDAKPDENFCDYLRRVDPDAGLAAQFIWAYNTTLAPMQFTNSYIQSGFQSCSLSVCYEDLMDNCNATWHRILQTWQVEEPQRSAMFRGAVKTCPDAKDGAMGVEKHSTRSKMALAGIVSEREYKLVSRARKLDKVYMHERLATLEHELGCAVTGKYAEPSTADN
eukprot:TRINITY_DN4070_c0_g1_i9.p1 TRINITY_DN4070_c0_g1~~TRINITY_DN4070_c0_g1_i9.p1  ORF type:complete len:406 (+),score=41.46 TRINITY_DN4070_c0_g1_i9:127-1218(+)